MEDCRECRSRCVSGRVDADRRRCGHEAFVNEEEFVGVFVGEAARDRVQWRW